MLKRYEVVARYWKHRLTNRLPEERVLRSRLIHCNRAIDVGANHGIFSLILSRLCDSVEAFEPNPSCARTLRQYRAGNIAIHTVRLSSTEGSRELFIPIIKRKQITGYGSFIRPAGNVDYRVIEVPVRRLDDFSFRDVGFIKIDVEGHELDVIRGGKATITRERPILMVEIEQRHLRGVSVDDVIHELLSLGYRGAFYEEGRYCDIDGFDVEKHQLAPIAHPAGRRYVNNFFFFPDLSI
ncbi:FkbM family methyltransferase [Candidatus Thiosymbion oneisti]|uniref:FkbM family methyltransferase n=1 Tax=Candidatus Thiosymbion oneisti TaxID=589554 RepID=UPI0013FE4C04|nr:FkbM family methyltransferase [Candidatus Thiosymbion oneisti]